jgi:protein involved in polysaccharide export with SLBB domain
LLKRSANFSTAGWQGGRMIELSGFLLRNVARSLAFPGWLILLASGGPLAAQSGRTDIPAATATVLRAGDAVRVTVWQRPDLTGEFAIGGDGRIAHPILKDAVVAEVPFEQAVMRLADLLRSFHGEAHFVVEPLIRVGVGGEVRQPNLYHVPADMTVAYAVSRAGGPSERGRLDRVELVRDGRVHKLDLMDPSGEYADRPLQSGDQIRVARRRDILREYVMPLSSIVGAVAAVIRVTR